MIRVDGISISANAREHGQRRRPDHWAQRCTAISCAFVLLLCAAAVRAAPPSQYKPTMSEVMLLPQFCWGQFNPEFKGKGPQYDITQIPNCGTTNVHYCGGLVAMNRAKRQFKDRGYWISVAEGEFRYSANVYNKYPNCPLGPHLQQSLHELHMLKIQAR